MSAFPYEPSPSSRLRKSIVIALSALLGATLLAGCLAEAETVVADEDTGNRSIRIAFPFTSTMNSAILYGEGTGIFDDHNIDIEFIEIEGARGLAATVGGSVDMAITAAVNPVAALAQGEEFPIVAQIGTGPPQSVFVGTDVWEESGFDADTPWREKLEFLAGRPWGVSSPEGGSAYMARYLFHLAGLEEDDLNMQSLGGSSGVLAGLQNGDVHAASLGAPHPFVAEAEGWGKVFISVTGGEVEELTNSLSSSVVVTTSFLETNRELIDDFREALGEAQRLVYEDAENVDAWMYETYFSDSPEDAVLAGVAEQRQGEAIARTPEVSAQAAERLVEFMEATGQEVPENWRDLFIDLN